jgi:hypothetical protein
MTIIGGRIVRFQSCAICKSLTTARKSEVGLKALRSNRSGRPRSLAPRHEQQEFSWISGRDPRQYGLDFGLWQRYIVSGPVAERFRTQISVTQLARCLRRWDRRCWSAHISEIKKCDRKVAIRRVLRRCQTGQSCR